MIDPLATAISLLALGVSGLTAWLTLFRRGTVQMTQPMVIFFGPDGPDHSGTSPSSKVFLRTLIFSSSKRGRVIESMYLTLTRNESRQNFNIWIYGTETLVRGSGLYVDETGMATNDHFLLPEDGTNFVFSEGSYTIDVRAKLLGDASPVRHFSQRLEVSHEFARELERPSAGLYFDWGPDSERYMPHIREQPANCTSDRLSDLIDPTPTTNF